MGNTVDAAMEFYFKGVKYSLSTTIDLEQYLDTGMPPIYTILARDHGIDPYSYQYEMMEMEEVLFTNPQGFTADYLHDGALDMEGLQQRWREEKTRSVIVDIASRIMGIDDLGQHPGLEQALTEAYRCGKSSA